MVILPQHRPGRGSVLGVPDSGMRREAGELGRLSGHTGLDGGQNVRRVPDGALHHTGDDPTGGNSDDGDDETIEVDLSKVDNSINEILFVVTIHDAIARKQNYGQVRDSYIRIVDDSNGQEVAKYELGEDFSIETAVEFGRLYRRDGKWKFEAVGVGMKGGLQDYLTKYQ